MAELQKLMIEQLKDAYSAEKQGLRAMPRLAKKVTHPALKEALQMHQEQSEKQIERLEQCLEDMGAKAGRKTCEGMRGLIEEAQQEVEDYDKGELLDVVIIGAQQRMEHYEIAAYGTMVALARACGMQKVQQLLEQTLEEEKQADVKLSEVAEQQVNPAAVESDDAAEEEQPEPANDRRRTASKKSA